MSKVKSNSPVSSFGPELMEVLRRGASTSSSYDLPSPQAAFRFMSRINSLRAAMRRESHPDADRVYRAGLRIDKENRCRVIVAPKDSEFGDILSRSKTSSPIPEAPPPLPEGDSALPHPGVAPDSADAFLSGLASEKDDPPLK